jgi:hypothetical protein
MTRYPQGLVWNKLQVELLVEDRISANLLYALLVSVACAKDLVSRLTHPDQKPSDELQNLVRRQHLQFIYILRFIVPL